jgi:hypothetical protein
MVIDVRLCEFLAAALVQVLVQKLLVGNAHMQSQMLHIE